MARGPRIDYPGAHHHVFNRGIARRPVLECAADMLAFQDLLARAVADGLLEVHAFSLLTTHYHLLVGSPRGELSEAMRRVGNGYVRRFNRERRRDGSLMRGRFGSRLVASATYFEAVVRYIDRNPVEARMAEAPELYPHGSAWHYPRAARPTWLATGRVEAIVCDAAGASVFRPDLYRRFAAETSKAACGLVESRMAHREIVGEDPLDDLVRAGPLEVQRWMARKARLADGAAPGIVLLAPSSITVAMADLSIPDPPSRGLTAGLLRECCGLTVHRIASTLGCSSSTAARAAREHAASMSGDPRYAALAASVVHMAVRRDYGGPRRSLELPRRLPDGGVRAVFPFRTPVVR